MVLTINNQQVSSAEFGLQQFKRASASGDENRVRRTVENIENAAAVIEIHPQDTRTRYEFWDGSVLLINHDGESDAEIADSVAPRKKPFSS
jgi:hypothetical protein